MKRHVFLGKGLSALLFFFAAAYFVFLVSEVPRMALECLEYGTGPEIFVHVEPGKNALEAAEGFAEAGVVDNPAALARWFARFRIDRAIRPGTYRLRRGSPWEVAKQMGNAVPETEWMTILPGATGPSLVETLTITPEKLERLLGDLSSFPEEMRPLLPGKAHDRLAFLLPETYQVVPGEQGPAQMLRSASAAWWKQVGKRAAESGGNLLRSAIVASLIEKETAIAEERPIIAGVIENRLENGMPLQIDATVVYAWGLRGEKITRVLHSHLEIDSPYNTYKISGLPPGPICIPSKESWEAVLEPVETEYLFYVAGRDGRHVFNSTYREHLKAIRKVRKQLD